MSNPELHSYQVAMVVSTKIAEITSAIRNEKKTHGTLRFWWNWKKKFTGEWWKVNTSFSQIAQVKWSISEVEAPDYLEMLHDYGDLYTDAV